jgi:MFS transporter, DHA3 family, macrolide efflux protein
VLVSPLAGVLADRWNRRTAMVVSDAGSGLAVLAAALLFFTHTLQPWMVIPINLWMAAFNSLMWPAYTASITQLVPKEHFGRANGLMQLGEAIPQIAGPALAGMLYVSIQLGNMALIDFFTYLFSVTLMLLFVRIPRPAQTDEGKQARGNIWQEMRFGWDYIVARKGLLNLLLFFLSINFLFGVMMPLFTSLILDSWDAAVLGYLGMAMGIGTLAGTLVMGAWGGTRRKVYSLLGSSALAALFLVAYGLFTSIPLLAAAGFGAFFMMPILDGSSQAIWQARVAGDVQGRGFAVRRSIAWSASILAPLLTAPLADGIFKPGMAVGGWLVPVFGSLFGIGVSRGTGVLISLLGLLLLIVSLLAFTNPMLLQVETDLPAHTGEKPVVEMTGPAD